MSAQTPAFPQKVFGLYESCNRNFLMNKLNSLNSVEAIDKFVPLIIGELADDAAHDRNGKGE